MADDPTIQPGDMFMPHRDYNRMVHRDGDLPVPDCDGALRFQQRHARGQMIEIDCSKCHFGMSMPSAQADGRQSKLDRRLDRLSP